MGWGGAIVGVGMGESVRVCVRSRCVKVCVVCVLCLWYMGVYVWQCEYWWVSGLYVWVWV